MTNSKLAQVGSAAHGGATLAEGEDIVERARERGEIPTEKTFVQVGRQPYLI